MSAGGRKDGMAAEFRAAADRYTSVPRSVAKARRIIADQDLDVLIFADVGMDSLTATLAWSRMAPVQCVGWGHPDTTGSPHIDYFLSSDLAEAPDADSHYTEELVRLPLLATYFERPNLPVVPASASDGLAESQRHAIADQAALGARFGLNEDRNLYLCPQTLFKFHPDFDPMLAGILQADAQAQIVILEGRVQHWTDRLKRRFEKTLPQGGDGVTFLPAVPREDFLRLLAAADVILDPPHFGGGHTTYEALAVGAPVVTLPGQYFRSRITQAMYHKMGFTDLIVGDPEEFVDTAVRLGTDKSARQQVSRRILDSCQVLFDDAQEVRGLEDWLWSLTSGNSASRKPTVAGGVL